MSERLAQSYLEPPSACPAAGVDFTSPHLAVAGHPAHNRALSLNSSGVERLSAPQVGILMGSKSDWEVMKLAATQMEIFGIPHECRVISAHRTPDLLFEYAETAPERGVQCIIAGAGGSAHLPGMLAAKTQLPVLGVPIPSRYLRGQDSLYAIVQMPKGVPVATFAIGEPGAINAGLFAVSILALSDIALAAKLAAFRESQRDAVLAAELTSESEAKG